MLLRPCGILVRRSIYPPGAPGGAAPIPSPAPAVRRPSSFPHLPHPELHSRKEGPPGGGAYRTLLLPTSGMWAPLIQWAGQNSASLIQPIASLSANPTNPDSFMLGLSGLSWRLLWVHVVWRELASDSRTFHWTSFPLLFTPRAHLLSTPGSCEQLCPFAHIRINWHCPNSHTSSVAAETLSVFVLLFSFSPILRTVSGTEYWQYAERLETQTLEPELLRSQG